MAVWSKNKAGYTTESVPGPPGKEKGADNNNNGLIKICNAPSKKTGGIWFVQSTKNTKITVITVITVND